MDKPKQRWNRDQHTKRVCSKYIQKQIQILTYTVHAYYRKNRSADLFRFGINSSMFNVSHTVRSTLNLLLQNMEKHKKTRKNTQAQSGVQTCDKCVRVMYSKERHIMRSHKGLAEYCFIIYHFFS